jgi:hypothetical protein
MRLTAANLQAAPTLRLFGHCMGAWHRVPAILPPGDVATRKPMWHGPLREVVA